jgi:hypothetical protein
MVMIDIGIFIGDYLVAKRPQLHWDIYRGHRNGSDDLTGPNLKRPHLGGFPRGWRTDTLGLGYGCVAASRQRSHVGHGRTASDRDAMIKRCKSSLHLANVPDDGRPFISGHYSDEPI